MAHRRILHLGALALVTIVAACDEPGFGTAPQIRVTPTSHAFASVAVGDEDFVRVTITNVGGGTLTVTSIAKTPSSSADFSVPQPLEVPFTLTKGQSKSFQVRYSPSDTVPDTGRIVVKSSDRQSPSVNVDLRTLEIGPDIAVEPDVLDFGVVERGQTSTLPATIKNEGFADLVIDNIATLPGSDFAVVQPSTLPLTLAPGATAPLRVSYTPSGCAGDEEALSIFSNDVDEAPYVVTVRGRPPGPAVGAEPAALSFGSVTRGTPKTETLTVKNVGTADLRVSSVVLGIGTDPAFTIQAPATPLTLAANQTAAVQVTFTGTQVGIARGAVVVASDDCENGQLQIPLEAIATDGPAPLIQVTPASINFGNVASGAMAERTFNVVSIGQMPLNVTSIANEAGTSSEFSVTAGGGSFQLAACTTPPCPSRTVTVRYAPTNQGGDSGNLIVASNAANEPNAKVALQANGTAGATCSLAVTPFTLNFRSVAFGTFKDLPITLTNSGSGNCNYDKTEIPFGFLMGYSVRSQPGVGSAIGPGQSRQVVIRYQPPQLGQHVSSAIVTWNDPNPGGQAGTGFVILTGESVEANIEAVPGRLDVGTITIGCASPVTTVTIFNTGSASLTITGVRLQNSPSRFRIIQAPPPGTVLNGGASVDIKVQYIPTASTTDTDVLIIESNDRDTPQKNVPLQGTGTTITDVTDKFVQATEPKVDILFVIDNSGSMSEEQANLRTNFRNFAQFAQSLNVSYQVGVVTTDNPKLRGNPKIIRPSDPDPVGEFNANANVGTSGDSTEKGLEMGYRALTDPLISADNAGFLRQDASLEVIVVSDEEDQSVQDLNFYTAAFYSIKGARNTSLFALNAIAGDVPNGCDSSAGSAAPGARYQDIANRTGGVFGSVCDPSFAQSLQAIGNRAFGLRVQFFLSRQPDMGQPFTVRKYPTEAACDADTSHTGGTVVPANPNTGYAYDAQSNSIIFGPQAVPTRGTCIKVKYKAACIAP